VNGLLGVELRNPGLIPCRCKNLFLLWKALGPTQTHITDIYKLFPRGEAARSWSWPHTSI